MFALGRLLSWEIQQFLQISTLLCLSVCKKSLILKVLVIVMKSSVVLSGHSANDKIFHVFPQWALDLPACRIPCPRSLIWFGRCNRLQGSEWLLASEKCLKAQTSQTPYPSLCTGWWRADLCTRGFQLDTCSGWLSETELSSGVTNCCNIWFFTC